MSARTRRYALDVARWVFLALVLGFAWWGLRERGDEVVAAVTSTPVPAILVGGGLVVAGLLVTSVAWLRLLAGFGFSLPGHDGRAVFFTGQLGKYIPGAVWSMGAHAQLAKAYDVPRRVTVATSLAFLGVNLATSGLVVAAAVLAGAWRSSVPLWAVGAGAALCLVALTPPVVNRAGTAVSTRAHPLRLGVRQVVVLVLLMAITWSCYAGVVMALAPDRGPALFPLAAGAFAMAYGVGVLVVVAPAGVGAREVTLIALLSPVTGLTAATAIALLTRVLHTGGDLVLAAVSWAVLRVRRERRGWPDAPTPAASDSPSGC